MTIDREREMVSLIVPIVARPDGAAETIACLIVGRRPDGSVPDKGAIATLAAVTPAIGHAILAIAANKRRMNEFAQQVARRGVTSPT